MRPKPKRDRRRPSELEAISSTQPPSPDVVVERRTLFDLLAEDASRQLGSAAARSGSLSNRAAVLIAAVGISTGLSASPPIGTWTVFALVFGALATVSGIAVLWPRRGHEVNLAALETMSWNDRDAEAVRRLFYARLAVLRADETSLKWRRIALLAGFSFLALAIASDVFGTLSVPPPTTWSF